MTDEHTLQVTDKTTAEVQTAIPVKQDQWKISVESSNGKRTWRYFTKEQVDKNEVRKKVESIPFEERQKCNNVEATMFQYIFHTRNNKTRYRTKIKHTCKPSQGVLGLTCADFSCMTSKWVSRWQQNSSKTELPHFGAIFRQ